jgi:hypothetical protein
MKLIFSMRKICMYKLIINFGKKFLKIYEFKKIEQNFN